MSFNDAKSGSANVLLRSCRPNNDWYSSTD